jgi:hypothetical protein
MRGTRCDAERYEPGAELGNPGALKADCERPRHSDERNM